MKFSKILFPLFVTGALAQITDDDSYEDLCADKDGTTEDIIPGHTVQYSCGVIGPYSGDRVQQVDSAEDCAKICRDRPGCTGSSWAVRFKTCYVGTGTGDTEAKDRTWTLYMKNLTPPPEVPEEEDNQEESTGGGACNPGGTATAVCDLCSQLEQSNSQLEECDRSKGDCEKKLDQCLKDKEALESSQGTGGPGTGAGSGAGLPKCPESHNVDFTSPNGKTFKINWGNFVAIKNYKSKTFARCVDECAYYHNCKAVNYVRSGKGEGMCSLLQMSPGGSGAWRPSEKDASAILVQ
ncbi:unnamed protein product [Penicillium bialowiezense]